MKKFPVTSANGNEYLAKVEHCDLMIGLVLKVTIYQKKKRKFLWFEKEVFVELEYDYYHGEDIYRYVEAVQKTVADYEEQTQKELESEVRNAKAHKDNLKQFEEWDGVCK